jgi:hypothetical protein
MSQQTMLPSRAVNPPIAESRYGLPGGKNSMPFEGGLQAAFTDDAFKFRREDVA